MVNFFTSLFKKKSVSQNRSNFTEGWNAYQEARKLFHSKGNTTLSLNEVLLLFDKAVECGITKAYGDRAYCLQSLNYWTDSISDFDLAISFEPADANLYYGRGLAKEVTSDFEGAISDLEMAIKLAKVNNKLNAEYNDEVSNWGWRSVALFFESKLDSCVNSYNFAKNNPEIHERLQSMRELKTRANQP